MAKKLKPLYRPKVNVLVYDREGRVLASPSHEVMGHGFPGGGIEEGQSIRDAARREVLEEAGKSIEMMPLLQRDMLGSGNVSMEDPAPGDPIKTKAWARGLPKILTPDELEHWIRSGNNFARKRKRGSRLLPTRSLRIGPSRCAASKPNVSNLS